VFFQAVATAANVTNVNIFANSIAVVVMAIPNELEFYLTECADTVLASMRQTSLFSRQCTMKYAHFIRTKSARDGLMMELSPCAIIIPDDKELVACQSISSHLKGTVGGATG
jgi:hypothetical protein